MKKGLALLILIFAITVCSMPEMILAAEDTQTNTPDTEADLPGQTLDSGRDTYETDVQGIVTGTQEAAEEEMTDADYDIRDDRNALIGTKWEKISISNAEDLIDLAEHCRLDTWSCNKRVTLTDDISLHGVSFSGIPTFGGIFDGRGHTISDLTVSDSVSYVGFFSYVQENAVIRGLNVTGTVTPGGSQVMVGGIAGDNYGVIAGCTYSGTVAGNDYVGGIAGMNELTGIISDCRTSGSVRGVHFTGGVAGYNRGDITGCVNNAAVNTSTTDSSLTQKSVGNIQNVLEIIDSGFQTDDDEASLRLTVTDTGGIAGQSIGIISHCVNHSDVGYDHVGYNTGGIAGRQSGYVYACINDGQVTGRKDIGGIVGQAEPYITIDFSQDIAYQLSQAIGKLHDLVNVTLDDTRNQSDVLTARLAVIQQYTGNAITDARYLAENTVDYANGISAAANESFSRIDYILAQSSKDDGLLDQTAYAFTNIGSAMENARETVDDLELTQYMSSEEKEQYNDAKDSIEKDTARFKDYYSKAYRAYLNYFIWNHADESTDKNGNKDLAYKKSDGSYTLDSDTVTLNSRSYTRPDHGEISATSEDDDLINDFNFAGKWVHDQPEADYAFPDANYENDETLFSSAKAFAASAATAYANLKYKEVKGTSFPEDIETSSATVTSIMSGALETMSGDVRADAIDSINSLQAAAGNLASAGTQTKDMFGELASRGPVTFPSLSADYKAHTTSLADNLTVMNDNFGLLNQEINNGTHVLTDDLEAVSDQFNTIMMLYTDALDGVLEKDYTRVITDDSLSEAATCTDATLDSCTNYGVIRGDINVAGIAGTMAIEFDYDLESDVTGIKDSNLNTSYITKCVLRGNKNYENVSCVKSYAGGICGLQEMGTIISDENYSVVGSESGDYVGGIAGSSLSYILSSFARGSMNGMNYIGGIAGDGTNIRDCVALVDPDASGSWCGAIAGHIRDAGEVRNNYFVGENMAGIDRVSYSFKAEPISYDELMSITHDMENDLSASEESTDNDGSDENVTDASKEAETDPELTGAEEEIEEVMYSVPAAPGDFKNLTVTFILDDDEAGTSTQIKKIKVEYASSLDGAEYPEVPEKEGYYAEWDKGSLDRILTDQIVTATYKRYLTTLAGTSKGDGTHRSEILVDGFFREGDTLTVEKESTHTSPDEDDPDDFTTLHIIIPDDHQKTHRIRFKPEEMYGYSYNSDYSLLLKDNDEWRELERQGSKGEYDIYEVEGNDITLRADMSKIKTRGGRYVIIFVIAAVIAVALLIFIIWLVMRRKSRKQIKRVYHRLKNDISDRIKNKESLFIADDAVPEADSENLSEIDDSQVDD